MNALIQGSAARHTKLWMRACWREGIVPLLQMHDALDCSVSSPEQAKRVAQLGREAVKLEVPMEVDLAFGHNWGDAKHTWQALHATTEKPTITFGQFLDLEQDGELPDDNDDDDDNAPTPPQPAWQIDWGEALDRDFPCASLSAAAVPDVPKDIPAAPSPRSDGHGCNGYGGAQPGYLGSDVPKKTQPATYIYRDARAQFYMKVVRTAVKGFPTYRWENGTWVKGWPAQVLPFRLPELLAAPASEPIWICEGEKDANNVAALGLIATTNPGGADKWQSELSQWFKEKTLVYILEDNDDAGRKHTAKVIAALREIVPTIAVVAFPELPEKGDVSDWLELGGNRQLLLARAEQARKRSSNRRYIAVNAATVVPRARRWLWPGHLARGKLELMSGLPDLGKSQIHCSFAAHVTTGRTWPNSLPGIEPCRVIMLAAEDTTADVLVPRLKAAGADLALVEILKAIKRNNRDEWFLLAEDLEVLGQMIKDYGNVGLVMIDPITAYMGGGKHFDSHRATDVRAQLNPLRDLAEQTDVAFSALTHPPKNASATSATLIFWLARSCGRSRS
jgi:AAA domain